MTPSSTVRDGHELIILGEKDDRFYETSGTTCPGTQSHIIEEQNPQRYRCESLKLRSLARVIDKPCTKVGTMRSVSLHLTKQFASGHLYELPGSLETLKTSLDIE